MCLPRFPQTVGATGYSTPRLLSAAPPPAGLLWSWYAGGAPLAVAGGPVALPSPPFFRVGGSYARGHRRPYKVGFRLPSPPGILQDSLGCAGYGP